MSGADIKSELQKIEERIKETEEILENPANEELFVLAEEELENLKTERESLKNQKEEISSILIEIRAGAGGDEASLFAQDLLKMYSRYGQIQGWEQKILDSFPTELGGYKTVVLELKNKDAWSQLKREAGVHRVQRIPITEKGGRVHTSTASVAVLPKPKQAQINIRPQDITFETYKASGPGGQNVNKRMTAVRIIHIPTGIVVTSQTQRNLQQNKENALAILEAKILEKQREELDKKIKGERRSQIGQAKRAEKIRTYNFPQDRITDHRIKKSWHNIEKIMNGRLDPVVKSMQKIQD